MKNFKLFGVGNEIELGKNGLKIDGTQLVSTGMRIIDNNGDLINLSAALPTSGSHVATKDYVDNKSALILGTAVINAIDSTGNAGELAIVSVDGLTLDNGGQTPNTGDLFRWDAVNSLWITVALEEGMRISTSVAILDNNIDFSDGHVFVLGSLAPNVWIDNGPQPAAAVETLVRKSLRSFLQSSSVDTANGSESFSLGTIPAFAVVTDVMVGLEGWDIDFGKIEYYIREVVPTGFQSFLGSVGGVTGDVDITSNLNTEDNFVVTGDGVTDLATLVAANPDLTLNSANGADVPDDGAVMQLSGETDNPIVLFDSDIDAIIDQDETYIRNEVRIVLSEHQGIVRYTCGATLPNSGLAYAEINYRRE